MCAGIGVYLITKIPDLKQLKQAEGISVEIE